MKATACACAFVAACLMAIPALSTAQTAALSSAVNPAVRVTFRDSYKKLQEKSPLTLKSLTLMLPGKTQFTPVIDPTQFSAIEYAELASAGMPVNEATVDMQGYSQQDAIGVAQRLQNNPSVKSVNVDPTDLPDENDETRPIPGPDFGDLFGAYQKGWDEKLPNFALGGIDSNIAHTYAGADGSEVSMVVTNMFRGWEHPDLPNASPKLKLPGCNTIQFSGNGYAGIIAASGKNNRAIEGIVPKLKKMGIIATGSGFGVMDALPYLKRGDVLVLSDYQHASSDQGPGTCEAVTLSKTQGCWLPQVGGHNFNRRYEIVKYVTETLGIHVIVDAGGGGAPEATNTEKAVNLDSPYYEGRYNRHIYDDGAIYVGAADPQTGTYWKSRTPPGNPNQTNVGSRIDVFGWGNDVPSTGFPSGYEITGGPLAATAMVAGAVAQIQSIAFAEGLGAIPPKEMRELIVATGHPLPHPDPAHPIGVLPDVAAAVRKLLGEEHSGTPQGELIGPAFMPSGGTHTFEVKLSRPQNVRYAWHLPSGFTSTGGDTRSIKVTAPSPGKDQSATITVDVTDVSSHRKTTLSTPVMVKAWTPGELVGPEFMDAGSDGAFQVRLTQPPLHLRYEWLLPEGFTSPGSTTSSIRVTAPRLDQEKGALLSVRITDTSTHATATLSTPVMVKPTALAGTVEGPDAIDAGTAVTYHVVLNRVPAGNVTYSWSLPQGFTSSSGTRQADITFVAPPSSAGTTVRLGVLASTSAANTLVLSKTISVRAAGRGSP